MKRKWWIILICFWVVLFTIQGFLFYDLYSEKHKYIRSEIEGTYDRQVAEENQMVYLYLFNIQGFIQEKQWIFLINGEQYLPGYYPIKKEMIVQLVNEKNHKEIAGETDIASYLSPGDFVCYAYGIIDGKEILPIVIKNGDQTKEIEIDLRTNLQEMGGDIQLQSMQNI